LQASSDSTSRGLKGKPSARQGVNEELAPRLAAAVAGGAARYGHVMHPEVAIEPAVRVAERLLGGPGRGWAARVFFSDDG